MQDIAAEVEGVLRRTLLRRTYTLAGLSIALSGLIAAGIYHLMGEKGPLLLVEKLQTLPQGWGPIVLIGAGLLVLILMVVLGLVVMDWAGKLHIPLGLVLLAWGAFSAVGGLLLSPVFYIAGPALALKVFIATGAIFTATGLLASFIRIDLTRWRGQIFSLLTAFILMGIVNLFLCSEWVELAWMWGGLLLWIVVAVYAHQLLAKLPLPTPEEIEQGGLTRLAIGGALLLYILFYAIFLRLLLIALSQKGKQR